ncbi:hypothetical protein [Williamsia sp. M5A3_1d]
MLGLSRGTASWWPTGKQKGVDITWEKFAALMNQEWDRSFG